MEDEKPFVTVEPAVAFQKFCVEVRKWDRVQDGYIISRCSQALTRVAADALAKSWAAAMKLEIR